MKKIMIYTKNGFHAHNREGLFTEALKSKAFLIMLISLFFCGSVIGAVIFKNCKEYGFDFLNVFARFTITEQLNKIFFLSIICSSFIAVICMRIGDIIYLYASGSIGRSICNDCLLLVDGICRQGIGLFLFDTASRRCYSRDGMFIFM